MLNVIHGKVWKICQWCRTVVSGDKSFQMPKFVNEKIVWSGAFCCGPCLIAAFKDYSDANKLKPEEHAMLMDMIRKSLRRNDADKPTANVNYTINPAKDWKLIKGLHPEGEVTVEEFHRLTDPDGTIRNIFYQEVPPADKREDEKTKSWKKGYVSSLVPEDGKLKQDYVNELAKVEIEIPRNSLAVIEFLFDQATEWEKQIKNTEAKNWPNAIVIYKSEKTDLFAIGLPDDLMGETPKQNELAKRILGASSVYGKVQIIGKQKQALKLKKGTKRMKKVPAPVLAPAPAQAALDEDKKEAKKISRKRPAASRPTIAKKVPRAKKAKVSKASSELEDGEIALVPQMP